MRTEGVNYALAVDSAAATSAAQIPGPITPETELIASLFARQAFFKFTELFHRTMFVQFRPSNELLVPYHCARLGVRHVEFAS
jgi:hypothetical protein